jgi:hypothetical protein
MGMHTITPHIVVSDVAAARSGPCSCSAPRRFGHHWSCTAPARPTYYRLAGARGALKDTTIERSERLSAVQQKARLRYGAAGAGAPTGLQNQYGVVARR